VSIAKPTEEAVSRAWIATLAGCFVLVGSSAVARTETNTMLGTWYVVVNYDDAQAVSSEDRRRWEDKVWVFELRGTRLVWTEYSELSFKTDVGRYQTLAGGREIKSSGSWNPNKAQRAEIERGLAANPQWVRTKTLRGDAVSGYKSSGRQNRESASVIGFSQTWEIVDLGGKPLFRRRDSMSGGRSTALEGETLYTTTARKGEVFSGEFTRDEAQKGTFVMRRAGKVQLVAEKEVDERWK
jgi:hypothetical protein